MALGLMFASCEDFLTEYPKNKITPDDFFKTEREISLYANSFYEKDHNMGEEYIAPMYNYLIAKEYIVKYDKIDGKLLKVFGVPNEYYDLVKSYLNE